MFRAQVEFIASRDHYTMADHIVALEDSAEKMGLSGWRSKLRSSKQQQELEDKFAVLEIAHALKVG